MEKSFISLFLFLINIKQGRRPSYPIVVFLQSKINTEYNPEQKTIIHSVEKCNRRVGSRNGQLLKPNVRNKITH